MDKYSVTGMSCAACVARIEKAVNKVPGVTSCNVSLLTNSMGVEGNAKAGCKYIRDEYWKAYGNSDNPDEVGITLYNYQRTKTAGEGLINPPKD